ncbi:MAG: CapA family protein [Bacilli bacterium]|nr:CapA family protein [Bacilli bacterium]
MAKKKRRKIKPILKLLLCLILITIVCLLCLSFNDSFDKEKLKNHEENKLSLIMAGDVLIHSSVYDDAYEDGSYNFDKMLSLIKPITKDYDLAFYNQESILGGTKLGLSSYPAFNSPQEVGEAFASAGFNLVSLANNHTLDLGKKGVTNSNDYWKTKKGILTSGSYNSLSERDNIQIKEKNGIKYALLAYTTTTNGIAPTNSYYVNVYSEKQVEKDIKKIRGKVDLLLVSMHWGEEYNSGITDEQNKIANYLSNLEVDIIIGHHPHVIEPVDYIGDTLVIYSLGNFLSGQEGIDKRIGLMVSVDIEKEGAEITISAPTATLTYTHYKESKVKSNFKVYPFDKLNNSILPRYRSYYEEYMDIVTKRSGKIIESPI